YLTVVLRGAGANTAGIGAKVIVKDHGSTQLLEQEPTRGFLSSVEPRLHFGLGQSKQIDSLIVIWPDRRFQVLTDVAVNRTVVLSQSDATGKYDYGRRATTLATGGSPPGFFSDVTARVGVNFKHEEDTFFDYNREPLMPHLLSTEGPALAVADVNGDGLDDIFVGGAKWQTGKLFLQRRDGTFSASSQPAFAADSVAEDVDAAFFDANGDGHPDLFVVSGGNEFWETRSSCVIAFTSTMAAGASAELRTRCWISLRTDRPSRSVTSTATATLICSSEAESCRGITDSYRRVTCFRATAPGASPM
ncbi:MAG TPA: ASPIC/UnbV domain-containing protein, partial [Gemmatimonadaceae bacterium]|nr:ASPIC/UnbV domain-containing protein [Gemmatimonadaceae bacterium]